MYTSIYAFKTEDLETMNKQLLALGERNKELGITQDKGDRDLADNVKDHMGELVSIIGEYMHTWAYVETSELVLQERQMLFDVFQHKKDETGRAISDWEESITWNEWHQVSGDVNAAAFGAIFCKADKYGYAFVEVINLETASGEGPYEHGVYWVEEHYVDRNDLDSKRAEQALRSCGDPDRTDGLSIALAMMEYGGQSAGYAESNKTLADAMKRHDIPMEALWEPKEYFETWEEEKQEEDEEDELKDLHSALALCNECGHELTKEEQNRYPFGWQHSGDMYCDQHETREQFKHLIY